MRSSRYPEQSRPTITAAPTSEVAVAARAALTPLSVKIAAMCSPTPCTLAPASEKMQSNSQKVGLCQISCQLMPVFARGCRCESVALSSPSGCKTSLLRIVLEPRRQHRKRHEQHRAPEDRKCASPPEHRDEAFCENWNDHGADSNPHHRQGQCKPAIAIEPV